MKNTKKEFNVPCYMLRDYVISQNNQIWMFSVKQYSSYGIYKLVLIKNLTVSPEIDYTGSYAPDSPSVTYTY
jgi:hypothetical protein